jgi:hypothetical protein
MAESYWRTMDLSPSVMEAGTCVRLTDPEGKTELQEGIFSKTDPTTHNYQREKPVSVVLLKYEGGDDLFESNDDDAIRARITKVGVIDGNHRREVCIEGIALGLCPVDMQIPAVIYRFKGETPWSMLKVYALGTRTHTHTAHTHATHTHTHRAKHDERQLRQTLAP